MWYCCYYVCSEFIHGALWRTLMSTKYFFVCSPQAFSLSSAPGVFSTLVTSVVLFSLTRATLMSPGQDETRLCGYIYTNLRRNHETRFQQKFKTKLNKLWETYARKIHKKPSILKQLFIACMTSLTLTSLTGSLIKPVSDLFS